MRIYELVESPVDTDDDTVIDRPTARQRQEVPLYVPGGFTVVILNDPVTPFEVVIEAVVAGTRLSPGEAARRHAAESGCTRHHPAQDGSVTDVNRHRHVPRARRQAGAGKRRGEVLRRQQPGSGELPLRQRQQHHRRRT